MTKATAKAWQKVDQTRREGDVDGAGAWLRIIMAIGTLGMPPTDAAALNLSRGEPAILGRCDVCGVGTGSLTDSIEKDEIARIYDVLVRARPRWQRA
jgi:hypothetical protein